MTPSERERRIEAAGRVLVQGGHPYDQSRARERAARILDAADEAVPMVSLAALREKAAEGDHEFFVDMHTARVDAERRAERAEAAARDALEVLAGIARTGCREWLEGSAKRCNAPAEFILWGKLFPPEALGPRCHDHAATHAGHRALGDPSWAIVDLRPAREILDSPSFSGEEGTEG